MAGKLLLCICATHAAAARWQRGGLVDYQVFDTEPPGLAGLRLYLQAAPQRPLHLLLDVVEEDYRCETLPHSRGRERADLLARKLRQLFRDAPYTAAWAQGRDASQRRDDRFLFAALTNPDSLAPWLQLIAAQPLAGIYLLPMVSVALIERLGCKQPNLLLICQHHSGLRISFFRNRQLRISRLIQLERRAAASSANCAQEIHRTRLYLETLKVLGADETLMVVILDPAETLADLNQELAQQPNTACHYLTGGALAAQFKLDAALLRQHAEALHLHLLGWHPPPANLAPPQLTVAYRHYQARRALHTASVAIACACASCGSIDWYRQTQLAAQTAQLAADTRREQDRYRAVIRQFPDTPVPGQQLKQAVETVTALKAGLATPEQAYVIVSRALEASPSVLLKSLRWQTGGENETGQDAALAVGRDQQSVLIEAELQPFQGDYRDALAEIDRFAQRIQQQQPVRLVRTVQLPLNISPSGNLSGNTIDDAVPPASARFKLALVLTAAP